MVAAHLGTPLMQWQQDVVDVVLELDPETGELVFDEWVLTVPRQSGKSTLILAKVVHRASATGFFGSRQRMSYAAQTRQKAREKWEEDYAQTLERSRKFRSLVNVHKGNGNEHIRFPNGSRFGIEANTEKAGHGGTLDEAYVDEAFSQVDNRLEQAFGPAMITRLNKQLGIVSTMGWSDASPYFMAKVQIGRNLVAGDVRRGTAYFEWSAPEDADPADESVWLGCMPAVHRLDCEPGCRAHTVRLSAIRSEFEKARLSGKISDFRRAYLNQCVPKPREAEETALGNWAACGVVLDQPPVPESLGVAVSLDREWASIAAAGTLPDGRYLVAAVDRREGTGWLAGELVRIQREHNCAVIVADKGPASDLIGDFEDAGANVTRAKVEDYIDACASISDDVRTKAVAHLHHPDLDESVVGARWRSVNDRRVFGRKQSVSDVSMLEAATLASWGLNSSYDVLDSVF